MQVAPFGRREAEESPTVCLTQRAHFPPSAAHIIRLASNQMERSSVVDSGSAGSRIDSIRTVSSICRNSAGSAALPLRLTGDSSPLGTRPLRHKQLYPASARQLSDVLLVQTSCWCSDCRPPLPPRFRLGVRTLQPLAYLCKSHPALASSLQADLLSALVPLPSHDG